MPILAFVPICIAIVTFVALFFWNKQIPHGIGNAQVAEQRPAFADQTYADGSYTTVTTYFTPKRVEHKIATTLDLEKDTIVKANVTYDGEEAKTPSHLRFDGAYKAEVLGLKLDDVNPSRVGGASLTTVAFNEAIDEVKAEARNDNN